MRFHNVQVALLVLGSILAANAAIHAQTDVALSLFGAFNQSTTGNNVSQSPSNQAGALVEVRHIVNPLIGFEATYSLNRANQNYFVNAVPVATPGCGVPCQSATLSGTAPNNVHEVTADWVVSLKAGKFRPFALAGGGLLVNDPSGATVVTCNLLSGNCSIGSATTSVSATGVLVYGAGLDWGLLPHLGLRLQYRGNLYKASSLISAFSSTGAFTHSAEPMVGAFFRF
jgi:hypothetical protein